MQPGGNKFDPSRWISKVLRYESYLRLMSLLFVLGLLVGLSYFVYTRAVYSSRALVQVSLFSATADDKGNVVTRPLYRARRQLMDQLSSRYLMVTAAHRAGFVPEGTSFGVMREQAFPAIRVGVMDEDFLEITTFSYYPEGVRELPKAMIEEYLEKQEVLRRLYREEAVERYTNELKDVRDKLDEKLKKKLNFEEENELAEISIQQDNLNSVPVDIVKSKDRIEKMDRIRENFIQNKDKLDVIAKLSLLNRFEQLEPVTIGKMIRRSRGGTSPVKLREQYSYNASTQVVVQPDMAEGLRPWQDIEKKKRILEERLGVNRNIYGEEHPVITELKAEIFELEDSLKAELEVKLKSFDLEYSQIQEKLKEMESKLPEYHQMTRTYDERQLDYDLLDKSELAWDQAHNKLSERIAGLEFGEGRRSAELQFSGFASLRDVDPISPTKMKLLTMGIVLGLAMAFGAPFLIEMFDDTSATLIQLETITGLTGIGVLPIESREDLENIVRSPFLEAKAPHHLLEIFRVIRSNVVLHPGPSGMSQVVMVTSPGPGEGKTTHATNLAWAFSSMGEKTLLVDCELRRGRIHRLAGINNEKGMTSLLTGSARDKEVMHVVEGVENLTVIPRGPVTPGATEVLCQDWFEELMLSWRSEYDRIVLDTPPVLGLSETVPLQKLTDGVIMVVKADSTARRDLVESVNLLRKGDAHFFGLILNQIDLSKRSNHYNYFYYSSTYYGQYNDIDYEEVELLEAGV